MVDWLNMSYHIIKNELYVHMINTGADKIVRNLLNETTK